MSSEELSLFSYEILGLVGRQGAGAHDLMRMARRGRMLDWAGESRYYTEPKRLAELGYLEARKEPGQTRERTVYSLSGKGLEALREWAKTPVEFMPFKSEALTRMLIADLVGERVTRDAIATLRPDLADVAERLDQAEASAATLPHREKYLRLTIEFLRRLLEIHEEWIEEVQRELSPSGGTARPRRARRPRRRD
jgi:DNA-binding PadR family transcriptional regulator